MDDNGEALEANGSLDEEPEETDDTSEEDAAVREKSGLSSPRENI